jgi:RND superfamily putative drug exporter
VFERRRGPLTAEDRAGIEDAAKQILQSGPGVAGEDLHGVTVRSPGSIPLSNNPLISPVSDQGQAALIVVGFPVDYLTSRSARLVDHIDGVLAHAALPQGLGALVTGPGGFGHDYLLAAERSNRRTTHVTLAAVIVILLLVYRAPLAMLVPLVSISLAAVISLKFLDLAAHWGTNAGAAERIFATVLLYGAGTDYAMLLISRYREFLRESASGAEASGKALNATWSGIAAAGLTNVAGMVAIMTASYGIYRTMGPLVAVCLAITLLVSLTLVPALLAILGRVVFWPWNNGLVATTEAQRQANARPGDRIGLWPRVARLVTARPGLVLIVGLGALAAPAAMGAQTPWIYDAMTAIGAKYDAPKGADAVKRHWPVGQVSPLTVLIETPTAMTDEQAGVLSQQVTNATLGVEGVHGARSLSMPLGSEYKLPALAPGSYADVAGVRELMRHEAKKEYVGRGDRAMRVVVVLDQPAMTLKAMEVVKRVGQAAQSAAGQAAPGARVCLVGVTVMMADVQTLTQRDFHRIAALVLCLIFAVVFTLLRDVLLCLFVVFCTVLSYLATLGLSYGVFVGVLGQEGLDWKVQLFLFVVMVAVGVDYSIFLLVRLKEEIRRSRAQAIWEAVVHTGPVISSCGIIMAATLGSPMAGDLKLLHQLGFAMATGMLMDTFVVRPLLLPSFAALKLRWKARGKR